MNANEYEQECTQEHEPSHSLTAPVFAARVRGAALGYLFIYINFNLNLSATFTLPLLPNALGWFMLYRVLLAFAPMHRSLQLLQTPCLLLGFFSMTQVFPTLLPEGAVWAGTLTLIFTLLSLYFHYQFLSDISMLVRAYGALEEAENLLFYRTALTIGTTVLYCCGLLPSEWASMTSGIWLVLLLLLMFTAICLTRLLFGAAKAIERGKVDK